MNKHDLPPPEGPVLAFEPQQVEALRMIVREMSADLVTRAEFERLEAMVKELLARTEPPPTQVTPEEIVIIAAAVTAYLGKRVRVRGARRLPQAGSSPWSQQGRVFVQASHNLGMLKRH